MADRRKGKALVMVVLFTLSLLSTRTYCLGDTVPLLEVLKEGQVKDDYGHLERIIVRSPAESRRDISVCFWLHPYRLSRNNCILSFMLSSLEREELAFNLLEGKLIVKLSTCIFMTDVQPIIREWTHISFTLSNNIQIIANEIHSISSCNVTQLSELNAKEVKVKVGKCRQTQPFSGKLADIRIYWRALSLAEMSNISKVLENPVPAARIMEDDNGYQTEESHINSKTYVEISSVDKTELLAPFMPYMLLYFSEADHFQNAKILCKKSKSSLPNTTIHGVETIATLINDYIQKSGHSITSFWMESNSPNKCITGFFTSTPFPAVEMASETCDNTLISQICIIKKRNYFTLIGYSEQNIKMFPVPYESMVFESLENLRLYMQNDIVLVKDLLRDNNHCCTQIAKKSLLFGRNKWYTCKDHSLVGEMTLTSCDDSQYTCSDGQCIELSQACDLHFDCFDRSDELRYCEVGLKPSEFYNANLPPSSFTKRPTKLGLDFNVSRISKIDLNDNTFELTVDIKISWTDPRLEFKFLRVGRSTLVSKQSTSLYWKPDIRVNGAIRDDQEKLSFQKDLGGLITATARARGSTRIIDSYEGIVFSGDKVLLQDELVKNIFIICNMDLFFFPFDRHKCNFSLELINFFEFRAEWNRREINANLNLLAPLPLYGVLPIVVEEVTEYEVEMSLSFYRKSGAYLFNTFLPCIILEIIGLMTPLFPVTEYSDRVTITLSCLIVMAALFTQVSSSLPMTAEPKLIDIWMFVHILLLLIVFTVHVIVIHLHNRNLKAWKGRMQAEQCFDVVNIKGIKDAEFASKEKNADFRPKCAWEEDDIQEFDGIYCTISPQKANRIGLMLANLGYCTFLVIYSLMAVRYFN